MTVQSASAAVAVPSSPSRRRRRFVLHVAEMLGVMFAGMIVLGGVVAGVLAVAGTSLSDGPKSVSALVMGFNMTVPMVWWMRRRGHGTRDNVEMAASMIVPTLLAIGLSLVGVLAEHGILLVQHAVMIPAMVGLMLWRYDHYAH